MFSAKDKFAKILVFGEQESFFTQRERDHIRVAQTNGCFRDIEYIVAVRTQKRDQWRRNPFVREPAHLLAINDVFVGEIVGGKCLRGQDIISRQPRMVGEDRLQRHAGAQLAENEFHRNARAANNRLAVHDIRVNFDPFVRHDILLSR